jgi:gag-polyprotein putative aspartyl protease
MKKYDFDLQDEDSLVVVDCKIHHHNFALAVDTGASHTVIDLTALLLIGFTMNDVICTVQLETGKGVIDAYVFKAPNFFSLGKIVSNMEVCSYDFIASAIFSDFDGVLGLDFFKGYNLNIDFRGFTITLT